MGKTVLTEQRGRVILARLSNPPHNLMNRSMVLELEDLVESAEADRAVGAVVLTGEPPDSFITHYDVEEILRGAEQVGRALPSGVAGPALRASGAISRLPGGRDALGRSPAGGLVELRRIHDLFDRMNGSRVVYIAAVNGAAAGGGCELALACDVRIISTEGGPIGLPEMTIGITPGAGGTQRMARLLGQGRALEMILEARLLEPEEAARVGLVHRVVPAESLLDDSLATATRLSRRSPATVEALKRAVYEGGSKPLAEGLHVERTGFMSVTASAPALRAMSAYVEELAEAGVPPFRDPEVLRRWQDGTAVDMVSDG